MISVARTICINPVINSVRYKSGFLRNVGTLFTGTSVAQILPLVISPFLTRVYSPEEFGILAMFVAFSSVIGVISTGRYELAIIQAKSDRMAVAVFALSISIALSFIISFIPTNKFRYAFLN